MRERENFEPQIEEVKSLDELERFHAFALLQNMPPAERFKYRDIQLEALRFILPDRIGDWDERTRKGEEKNFIVRDESGQIVATSKVDLFNDKEDKKYAYLSFDHVQEDFRGRGLMQKITEQGVNWAREKGAERIEAEVAMDNPVGLVVKFHNGFILAASSKEGYWLVQKKFRDELKYDRPAPAARSYKPEHQEVNFAQAKEINKLLEQGWVGIDLKNLGAKEDNNPEKWNLILEKS